MSFEEIKPGQLWRNRKSEIVSSQVGKAAYVSAGMCFYKYYYLDGEPGYRQKGNRMPFEIISSDQRHFTALVERHFRVGTGDIVMVVRSARTVYSNGLSRLCIQALFDEKVGVTDCLEKDWFRKFVRVR